MAKFKDAGISFDESKDMANELTILYEEQQRRMLAAMADRLSKGKSVEQWQIQKIRELGALNNKWKKELKQLELLVEKKTPKLVEQAFIDGQKSVDKQLSISNRISIAINERQIEAIAAELSRSVTNIHPNILRVSNDIYRRVVADGVASLSTGRITLKQSVQESLNKFAQKGIQSFIDKRGRVWRMESYVEMATRTGLVRANLEGTIARAKELNVNKVIVSYHAGACPLCRPWENRILDLE